MNLKESTDEASNVVFYANFNQDYTHLSVGSKNVFRIYSLGKVDDMSVTHGFVTSDIRIVESHVKSNLTAVVHVSAPRILRILDTMSEFEVRRFSYPNTILAVKLNKSRLVVCLEENLYIQCLPDTTMGQIILDTPPNPLGLCILSQNEEKNFLAYPGSSSNGKVKIYDTFKNCSMGMIAAHENPLTAMAFNATGTKIATASDTSTVIRVFDVIEKTKLYEFRLGVISCARIYSLCFSEDSNYLSSSSNTDTVHIFRLDNMREASAEEPQGLVSYLPNLVNYSTNVMVGFLTQGTSALTSILYKDAAFATVRLPFSGIRNICALAMIQGSLRVLIVSGQCILYIYNVDSVNGGECVLEHTHDLSDGRCKVYEDEEMPFFVVDGFVRHQQAHTDTEEE